MQINSVCRRLGKVFEGVVAQLCNPLTLQPKHSGGGDSITGRAQLFSVMTSGRGLDKCLATSAIPALGAKSCNFTVRNSPVMLCFLQSTGAILPKEREREREA